MPEFSGDYLEMKSMGFSSNPHQLQIPGISVNNFCTVVNESCV